MSTPSRLPPHKTLPQYYTNETQRRALVTQLFDASARYYDRINAVMSFGSGRPYRQRALLRAGLRPGMAVLDVGCGTGVIAELAAAIVGPGGRAVALDPSMGMLTQAVARRRAGLLPVQALGEQLPFADASFDLLTMGYALRHVADLRAAFAEYRRVLKPGGTVLLLEIARPAAPLARYALRVYLQRVIPVLTRVLCGSREAQRLMSYYWDTVEHCVSPELIQTALREAGFGQVACRIELKIFHEYSAGK